MDASSVRTQLPNRLEHCQHHAAHDAFRTANDRRPTRRGLEVDGRRHSGSNRQYRHPRERVDWACGQTLQYRLFRYRTLRRLVEQAAERAVVPRLLQEHAVIRDLREYAQIA